MKHKKKEQWGSFKPKNSERLWFNLRSNWFLPISSVAFGLIELTLTDPPIFWISLCLAATAMTLFAAFTDPVIPWAAGKSKSVLILALLAAVGICWRGQQYAYSVWKPVLPAVEFSSGTVFDSAVPVSLLLAIASFPVVFAGTIFIWSTIWRIGREAFIAREVSAAEITVYVVLLVVLLRLAALRFQSSNAYYGGLYDVVYTSDSPSLGMKSSYFNLKNWENDIRQPLFAVFSSPVLGVPYLVGTVFLVSYPEMALLMNSTQIVMLLFSFYLIGRAMHLNGPERVCWMLFCSSTYTCLLFSVMMDQYIVAFFWLSIVVYQACVGGRPQPSTVWAAAGTMLPGIVLLPLASPYSPRKRFREWFLNMLRWGSGFIALMIVFYRFDIIAGLVDRLEYLSQFAGEQVGWHDKVLQYLAFPGECLAAPRAVVVDDAAWRLSPIADVSGLGVITLVTSAVSAVVNWENKISRVAVVWILVSTAALLIFGWGTAENGLNLYALYFGWAFFVLCFQFIGKIGEVCRSPWLLPAVSIAAALVLLGVNVPALQELSDFVAAKYPA